MPERLRSQEISDAVSGLGWRLVLGEIRTTVPAASLARAAELAAVVVGAAGADADGHVSFEARADHLAVGVRTRATRWVSPPDLDVVRRITDAVTGVGARTEPGVGGHAVQLLEIAIDALDPAAVRPFWKAVLGYADQPGWEGSDKPIVDPRGVGPVFWFQRMDAPRPQRNRVHVDVSAPHDDAERRIAAAVAAGGTVVGDEHAPAFWVLADPEGNEACVTTWQGRD